jgi:hypothetical protein
MTVEQFIVCFLGEPPIKLAVFAQPIGYSSQGVCQLVECSVLVGDDDFWHLTWGITAPTSKRHCRAWK